MSSLYNPTMAKRATNLSVNSDLLAKARALNINLSATLEKALEAQLKQAMREKWVEDNEKALHELNGLTDSHGLFADAFREFS